LSSSEGPAQSTPTPQALESESGLDKERYQTLLSQLNFRPALAPTLGIIVLDLVMLAAATLLLRRGGAFGFLLSQCLLAIVFFNSFSILHECGHGSASRSRALNAVLGHLASTFCLIPYYPWKYIHQKHHMWTGNLEQDPVLKSLRTFKSRGVPKLVRFSWRTWIPLGALLQHVVYLGYPIVMWKAGEVTRPRAMRIAISLFWMPLSILSLHFAAPDVVRFSNVILAFVLFLVAEELVNLPHHVGMPTFQG
jgi:acyl-lipid omega-6 desaturase (Delta-12 desaturase)